MDGRIKMYHNTRYVYMVLVGVMYIWILWVISGLLNQHGHFT